MYKTYQESTREEYYEQFTFPNNVLQFHRWQNVNDDDVIIKSAQIVNFRKVNFGSAKKNVIKEIGKPRFVRTTPMFGEAAHEIFFYKEVLDGNKLISQFHFVDDCFFYGCHTFRYLSQEKFHIIINLLFEKHIGFTPPVGKNVLILDGNNHQIRCEDDVFLNLVYLSGDENIRNIIQQAANEYTLQKNLPPKEKLKEVYNFL